MKKILKDNLWRAIVSSVIVLLPTVLGLIFRDRLAENTVWGSDSYLSTFVIALPILMLVLHWAAILITSWDFARRGHDGKVLKVMFWILPMITLFTSAVILVPVTGNTFTMERVTPMILGLMFIVMGNIMPKAPQNSTFGIKIVWAYSSRENWLQTHRIGGKCWVVCGFVILLAGLLLPIKWWIGVLLIALLAAAIIPAIFSYRLYKKELAEGKCIPAKSVITSTDKKVRTVVIALVAVLIAVLGYIMFTGEIEFTVTDSTFEIKADYFEDLTVNFAVIDSAELVSKDDVGLRISGFNSSRLRMGTFQSDTWGSYTRYSYVGGSSVIVLKSGQRILVIGCETDSETVALYEKIAANLK